MEKIYKDSDFEDSGQVLPDSSFEDAAGRDYAVGTSEPRPPGALLASFLPDIDYKRALLTNERMGAGGNIVRSIPSMLAAAPGYALGGLPGAFAASAGGEGLRQVAAGLYALSQGQDVPTGGQVVKSMALQGAANAAGEGIGRGIVAAGPIVKRAVAQQMRILPNIETKVGEAVLSDLGILARARPAEEMTALYKTFEEANQLVSPRLARGAKGEMILKPGQAEDIVNDVYMKLANPQGAQPTKQALYEASQAARYLRDQAKFGNPQQAANLANITGAKNVIDSALEQQTAQSGMSYAALRKAYQESKIGQKFRSASPQNINREPNVLRSLSMGQSGAVVGGTLGHYLAGGPGAAVGAAAGYTLGIAAVSPAVWGAGIRATAKAAPLIKAAAQGARFAPGSIAAYYASPGVKE